MAKRGHAYRGEAKNLLAAAKVLGWLAHSEFALVSGTIGGLIVLPALSVLVVDFFKKRLVVRKLLFVHLSGTLAR